MQIYNFIVMKWTVKCVYYERLSDDKFPKYKCYWTIFEKLKIKTKKKLGDDDDDCALLFLFVA